MHSDEYITTNAVSIEHAAARPVIAPETIVCDHGKPYLSATFRTVCRSLGINLQPAHPDTPTDKPVVERTLGSVASLFAQYVAGEHTASPVATTERDAAITPRRPPQASAPPSRPGNSGV